MHRSTAAVIISQRANSLEHYGVKGMKWGVRKDRPSGTRNTSALALSIEAGLLRSGKDPETAARRARISTNITKALVIGAGVGLVAAGAYVGYHEYTKRFVGVQLAKGTLLHHLNNLGDNLGIDRRMYTTFKKYDVEKYKRFFPSHLGGAKPVFDTTLEAITDIRAPSQAKAKKLFEEFLASNPSVQDSYRSVNTAIAYFQHPSLEKADKTTQKKAAEAGLFIDFMKSKGFNALLDANDQNNSVEARSPLIVFDGAASLAIKGKTLLDNTPAARNANVIAEIRSRWKYELLKQTLSDGSKIAGVGALGLAAFSRSARDGQKAVEAYKSKNPDTPYSDAELYLGLKNDGKGTLVVDSTKIPKKFQKN